MDDNGLRQASTILRVFITCTFCAADMNVPQKCERCAIRLFFCQRIKLQKCLTLKKGPQSIKTKLSQDMTVSYFDVSKYLATA